MLHFFVSKLSSLLGFGFFALNEWGFHLKVACTFWFWCQNLVAYWAVVFDLKLPVGLSFECFWVCSF